MKNFFYVRSSLLILLFISLSAYISAEQELGNLVVTADASKSTVKGPYVDIVRFVQYLDENTALQELKRGGIDTYYFRVPLEVVSDLKQDPALTIYNRMAGSFGFLLNPAPPIDKDT